MDRSEAFIMIEFVLSKLWTVFFGLALIGVLVISFDTIDRDCQIRDMEAEMENIMKVLDDISDLPVGSNLAVSFEGMISEGEALEFENGSLRLSREDISFSCSNQIPTFLVSAEGELKQDFLICLNHQSIILIERSGSENYPYLTFHLAKSSMISFSTFTNR
jgi:hypothetical protein